MFLESATHEGCVIYNFSGVRTLQGLIIDHVTYIHFPRVYNQI